MPILKIADNYAVAPQISSDEVAAIAADGFVAIICNRPDNEEPGQPNAAEISAACEAAGISFHHIPVSAMPIASDLAEQHYGVIADAGGPVLGYCRSGQRSTIIYESGIS